MMKFRWQVFVVAITRRTTEGKAIAIANGQLNCVLFDVRVLYLKMDSTALKIIKKFRRLPLTMTLKVLNFFFVKFGSYLDFE